MGISIQFYISLSGDEMLSYTADPLCHVGYNIGPSHENLAQCKTVGSIFVNRADCINVVYYHQ